MGEGGGGWGGPTEGVTLGFHIAFFFLLGRKLRQCHDNPVPGFVCFYAQRRMV